MNLDKFRQLFNPLPGNHYLYISTKDDEITDLFESMMSGVSGELNKVLYNEDNLSLDKPYRAIPRDHDMVIMRDVYDAHKNQDMILKLAYSTLANTANIIILEKKGVLNIKETKSILEDKYEFRAPNEIDIIDGYDLVMAKKMHMWGNGL